MVVDRGGGDVVNEMRRATARSGRLRRAPRAAAWQRIGATAEEMRSDSESGARQTNSGPPNGRGLKLGGSEAEEVVCDGSCGVWELLVAERQARVRSEVGADTSTRSVSGVSAREVRLILQDV
jgi:hypothetical protein